MTITEIIHYQFSITAMNPAHNPLEHRKNNTPPNNQSDDIIEFVNETMGEGFAKVLEEELEGYEPHKEVDIPETDLPSEAGALELSEAEEYAVEDETVWSRDHFIKWATPFRGSKEKAEKWVDETFTFHDDRSITVEGDCAST